jgi:DNA-binding transcriptional ArsR family regulator
MPDRPHVELAPEALGLVAARFRALGDPSRLRILNQLLVREMSVQQLVDATGLSQTATSRHLAALRAERIVERRAEGRNAFYRVVDASIAELCRIVCGGLERQFASALRVVGQSGRRRASARSGGSSRPGA